MKHSKLKMTSKMATLMSIMKKNTIFIDALKVQKLIFEEILASAVTIQVYCSLKNKSKVGLASIVLNYTRTYTVLAQLTRRKNTHD